MSKEAHQDQFERAQFIPRQGDMLCTLALIAAVRSGEALPEDIKDLDKVKITSSERAKTYGCAACMASLTDEGKPYIQGDIWCDLSESELTQVKEDIAAHVPKPRTANQ